MNKKNVAVNAAFHYYKTEKYERLEKETATPEYLEYRKNWVEYPKTQNAPIPLNIDIELTSACNLRCPMCPRTIFCEKNKKDMKGFITDELFYKIIDDAVNIGVPAIKLNWRGESTIHPHIIELITYAKQKGIIDVLMNTNGTTMTEEFTEKLIKSGIDKVFFSFDSPHKETYESIRVGAQFEKVVENIKRINKIKEKLGTVKPLTRISRVNMPNDDNEELMKKTIELFGDAVDGYNFLSFSDFAVVPDDEMFISEKANSFLCPMPYQRITVSCSGKVYPCCSDTKEQYCIGDLNTDSIMDIWTGERLNNLRKMIIDGSWKNLDTCRNCFAAAYHQDRKDGSI
ncbi:MAG: radical SAM protein [Oscillospiraceae bacterium]|jgi:radical SAM protein with 4Fe4S-binding SPASM domain|nr:radical SAM protein [Oscillospiraceae bacterium]